MFRSTASRVTVIVGLVIILALPIIGIALSNREPVATYTEYQPSVTATTTINTPVAVDLSGRWESNTSTAGTKMVGQVENGTIHVEMYADQAYTGLWYGTFDILQPGEKTLTSKYIDDPAHFVLSNAETKDFTYDSGALKFDFSVMGTRTTVEMRRVAG